MKNTLNLITFILTIVLFLPQSFAADHCEETNSYEINEFGIEIHKMERRCKKKASVKAKDEYRFRFPDGKDYYVYIKVNKERSEFNECRIGSSEVKVRGNGKWSSMIYVESEEKETMPSYRMEFKYTFPHDVCGQINRPPGYVVRDRKGKCYYQKSDCTELCDDNQMGQWTDDDECLCTPKDASSGLHG